MKTLMACLSCVIVLATVSDALLTSSCTGLVMFRYLDRKTQSTVDLPCADYCPPTRSKDADIFFCYKNCRSLLQCQLSSQPNVLSSLERRRVGNASTVCITDTWFFHPKYKFTSCQSVCSKPDDLFCLRNCPDYSNYCLSRLKPNRTSSITERTGRGQQSTTTTAAAAAGSDTSTVAKSTTSITVVSSQTHSPDDMQPSSSGHYRHSLWFPVTVIVAVVLMVVLAVLLIICLLNRQRSQRNNVFPKVPAEAAEPNPNQQDNNSSAATHRTRDSAGFKDVDYEHLPPSYDPRAPGPFDFRSDYEDEKMLPPRV